MWSCSWLIKLQNFYISCINYSSPTVCVTVNLSHSHHSLKLTAVSPSQVVTLVVNPSDLHHRSPPLLCWFSPGILQHSITFYERHLSFVLNFVSLTCPSLQMLGKTQVGAFLISGCLVNPL